MSTVESYQQRLVGQLSGTWDNPFQDQYELMIGMLAACTDKIYVGNTMTLNDTAGGLVQCRQTVLAQYHNRSFNAPPMPGHHAG